MLGAAIKMSLMESNTPLPNLLGKLTTTLQIIYICIIFVMEIFNINFPLIVIDILIVAITSLSLLVYSYKWFRDLKVFHNE